MVINKNLIIITIILISLVSFSSLNPIYALNSAQQSLTQVNIGGVDNGLCLGALCNADILNVAKLTSPSESSDGEFSDDLILPEPTTPTESSDDLILPEPTTPTESSDDLILPEPEELSNQPELESDLTNEELSYFRNLAERAVALTGEELSTFRNLTEAGLDDYLLYIVAGFTLHNHGKYLLAIPWFAKSITATTSPGSQALALNGMGLTLLELGRYQEAITIFDRALDIDFGEPDITTAANLEGKGVALYKMERYEEAINYFDRALDISLSDQPTGVSGVPQSASILNNWGLALYKMERYEEAINYFDRALKGAVQYSPEDIPSYIINLFNNKGAALSAQGRYPEAIIHYNRVLALKPYDADALNNKGNALSSLGRYQEAAEQYDKALEALQNPTADEEAKIRSGSIQIDELSDYRELTKYVQFPTGDLKKGGDNIQAFETTIYLDRYKEFNGLKYVTLSKDSEIVIVIQFNKGVNLYLSKNYNDANNNFDKVLKINSGFPPGIFYKGLTLEKLGQTDKAEIFKQKFEGLNSNYKGEKLDTTLLNVPKVAFEDIFLSQ